MTQRPDWSSSGSRATMKLEAGEVASGGTTWLSRPRGSRLPPGGTAAPGDAPSPRGALGRRDVALQTVYIETTIPSIYCDRRRDRSTQHMREATRAWWTRAQDEFRLVTSGFVLAELDAAPEAPAIRRPCSAPRYLGASHTPPLRRRGLDLHRPPADASGRSWRCGPLGGRHLVRLRLPGDLELPAPGQCSQGPTHRGSQPIAWPAVAASRNP